MGHKDVQALILAHLSKAPYQGLKQQSVGFLQVAQKVQSPSALLRRAWHSVSLRTPSRTKASQPVRKVCCELTEKDRG